MKKEHIHPLNPYMENSFEQDYPNAWKEWKDFSSGINIEFQEFYNWCSTIGIDIAIVQYPVFYSVRINVDGDVNEFGEFETWFEALDAVVKNVFDVVENWYDHTDYLNDLYMASKELDTKDTSKEGILNHYSNLILEMGDQYKEVLERLKDKKEPNQTDLDKLDSIIIIALSCKRLLTE